MSDNFAIGMTWIVIAVFAVMASVALCSVSQDTAAPIRAIEAMGFAHPIVAKGDPVFGRFDGCGKDEIAYNATADRDGKRVRLVACCGVYFKACTVRVP